MLERRIPLHVGCQLLYQRQQHVLLELAGRPEHQRRVCGATRTHHERQVRRRQRLLEGAVHVAASYQRLDLSDLYLQEDEDLL